MKIMQMPTPPNSQAGVVAGVLRAMGAGGGFGQAADFAKAIRMPEQVAEQLNKAAISMTQPITPLQATQFLAASAPFGFFDRVVADSAGRQLPLDAPVAIEVGGLLANPRTGLGEPIALGKLTLAANILVRREVAVIIAITKELLRAAGTAGEATLSAIARAAIAQATDRMVFDLITSTGTPSASAADFAAATSAALQGLSVTATSRVYLALSPQAALLGASAMGENGLKFPALAPNGGQIGLMPAVVTAGLDGSEVVAIDADGLAVSGGELAVDVSGQADYQPNDAPAAGPQQHVSAWQTNTSLLRLVRQFGVEPLRVDAVSRVTITGT